MEERLNVRIGANISDFERKMSQMQSKIDSVGKSMSSVGKGMSSVGKGMTAGLTLPVAGAVAASIKSFADLEQAVGGVETLFKGSADAVIANSETAYKRAGVSGVDYMENVTSFSATLLQGLEGDTVEAAKAADMAMVDMSDNANKFGTDIGSVQDAYQGFAKDNYTMLDNLKLGYGGTAGEMARLINESGVLGDSMEVTAETVKDVPFHTMVEAIHEVQTEMGVTGTTMKEAEETVSGSFGMMKASFQDLAAGFGQEGANIESLFSNLWSSVGTFTENIKRVLGDMWDNLPIAGWQKWLGVVAVAAGPVLLVMGKMITFVGGVVTALAPLLSSIAKAGGLLKWLTPLFSALTGPIGITVGVVAALGAAFVVAYKKSETFRNFISGFKEQYLTAWESVVEFKDKFLAAFEAIFAIFKGDEASGINMLESLGLTDDQIGMITGAIDTIKEYFNTMKDAIGEALTAVKNFFIDQFEGVRAWWDSDGTMILSAISTTFEWTMDAISDAVKFGLDLVVSLFEIFAPIVQGIWNILWPTIVYLTQTAWEKIKMVIGIAMDLVQGIISGVSAIIEGDWGRFGEVLKETAQSIWERVVEFFGNMRDNALELMNNLTGGGIDKFIELKDGLINRAIEIKDGVVNRITEMKDGAIGKVTEMYNSVTQWFSDLWSSVSNTASNIKNAVTNRFTEFKDNAISRVKSMFDSVTSWFSDMKTNVSSTASNIKTAVTNRFTEFKDNAIERSRLMYEGVKGWFGDTYTNTKNRASNIRDGVSTRFTTMKENAVGAAKSMWEGVSGFFDDIWDDTTSLFNNMVDSAKELPGRIGSAIKNMASHAVDGVSSMGKSLGDRLGSVVNGVVNGLNKVLGAIGVKKIPTISISTGGGGSGGGSVRGGHATSLARFSTGTMNGAIAEDMVGIVNDRGPGNGFGGATQELIRRDGKMYAPKGRDVEVNLKRGDEIFNGAQTQSLIASGAIPRFSQGTGTEGGDSGKKGLIGTLKDVVSNVWNYISDPKTAFGAIIDTVTPDFGGLSGFFGDMASGAFKFLKEKALSWLTGIFKENEGALGSGQKYAWMNYPITAGYSPNRPLAGYPSGFNGGRHYGVDFGTPIGTTVRAPIGGQLSSFWNEGGGKIAKLVTGQLRQFWMHMSSVSGSGSVSQGDIIGRTGNSGRWTTGPHVHYQAQQGSDALNRNTINPLKVINGYSNGGIVSKRQIAEIAEDGPEAVIPLSASKRGRANQLYDAVGGRIGRDDSKHYDRMINNQQTQIDQMTQAINVLLGIEDKSGITENDIGRANDKYNARQTSKRGATTGRLNYV